MKSLSLLVGMTVSQDVSLHIVYIVTSLVIILKTILYFISEDRFCLRNSTGPDVIETVYGFPVFKCLTHKCLSHYVEFVN